MDSSDKENDSTAESEDEDSDVSGLDLFCCFWILNFYVFLFKGDFQVNDMPGLRCGRIEKMHLRNFMCHANLEMEFNQKINLLVGNNGSGKSAIITALAIGLGADARSTNRGKNTKGECF